MKVRYSFACFAPGSNNPQPSVKVGQKVDLVLFAQDLRPEGEYTDPDDGQVKPLLRGVWAAYVNASFNKSYLQPDLSGIVFKSPYLNGKRAVDKSFGIGELGAFATFQTIGTELVEVVRVPLTAIWPATPGPLPRVTVYVNMNLNVQHPHYDTLVLGNYQASPPEYSPVTADEVMLNRTQIQVIR